MMIIILEQNGISSRMLYEEIGHVVDLILDLDPAVVVVDVLSELLPAYNPLGHINSLN